MSPSRGRWHIFISYSRVDRPIVLPVIALLRTARRSVFWDVDTIPPGVKWRQQIDVAIAGCSTFLLFWCWHSERSRVVKREWQHAIATRRRVVPVLLDSTRLPRQLREHQWIDLRDVHLPHQTREIAPTPPKTKRFLFEHVLAGRRYLIEVTSVSKGRWRASLVRIPRVTAALMPFYGSTPTDAAHQLVAWLESASRHAADRILSHIRSTVRHVDDEPQNR
jgi:hypothetical protein